MGILTFEVVSFTFIKEEMRRSAEFQTGTSRTAVFIAFDMLMQQASLEQSISVARVCFGIQRARPNMLQSQRRYALLYDLLCQALLTGFCIVDLDVADTYNFVSSL
ncbi:unnamed protein product [Protopolystoma xenopodis]|uniref:Tyrosine specific protein phosphatases domain-containing protein n=1 Tax=Protopolystoma xenopodis TaxID=117903 RepID=A0A448XM18_9PLAT|nr:unnamed protein product [Protopolystoma xenopodis]